jgi:lysophospholipase L1-like esterase
VGPDRILVQFGGNDLDCENASEQSAEEIILMLISICSLYLSRPNIEHVTILQLLPRHETRHCPPVVYNNLVRHANTYLKEQIQAVPGLHYWNVYGVKNSAVNIFVDGVHFNQDGFLRYYRNVRGAIVQSLGYCK